MVKVEKVLLLPITIAWLELRTTTTTTNMVRVGITVVCDTWQGTVGHVVGQVVGQVVGHV